jgi:2-keto-4-pentenoate hydratase|tara:strand:- start:138 stop:896 length:759 start_codon:yes stop_codon:yes gene_type:complete
MLNWSSTLLTSLQNDQPYPNLSREFPDASVEDAYAVQKQFVRQLEQSKQWGNIVGFKAAVTAPQAQQAMGIEAGIMGVLFENGAREANSTLNLDRPVLFETEIGFVVGKTISTPVTVDNVAEYIRAYMPVIELAAPNLTQRPNGVDIIAANSASYAFIKGTQVTSKISAEIDAIEIRQQQNNEELYCVQAGAIMAGQIDALTWLINEVLSQDYVIQPEQFLITGTIGPMVPAKPGNYKADFAQLGEIKFTVA